MENKNQHIVPLHNIKYKKETSCFLKSLLLYSDRGYSIENILYYIGVLLTNKKIPEYECYETDLSFSIPDIVKKEHDLLGSVYQYLTPKTKRLSLGSFYTSQFMTESVIKDIDIKPTDTIFDPSCGSGNLLFNSKVTKPEQITGIDIDPIAILCCKFNYYMKFGNEAPDPDIHCMDFFEYIRTNKKHFDFIINNPPFGVSINSSFVSTRKKKRKDSLTYFIQYTADVADKAIFILPESVLNVKRHTELRKWLLDETNITNIKTHGESFSGTLFHIVSITLKTKEQSSTVLFDGKEVDKDIFRRLPFYYFRPISKTESDLLLKVFSKQTQSLKNSVFGIGIVTGDNKSKLFDYPIEGSEPIITGKNISKYKISQPSKYIKYDRANLQQVAPDQQFRSPEKIVYKVVSRNMSFAIDYDKRLTLNSANFFIPKDLSISNKCIVALLNSFLYEKLNVLLFGENKISKTNLENLPLPDIDKELQKQLEDMVDKEQYKDIDVLVDKLYS
jgi:predicted RNA methylase